MTITVKNRTNENSNYKMIWIGYINNVINYYLHEYVGIMIVLHLK